MEKLNSKYYQIIDSSKPFIKTTLTWFSKIPIIKKTLRNWQGPCAIFCLHRVLPEKQVDSNCFINKSLVLSEGLFQEMLKYFSKRYRIVSMSELADHLRNGSTEFVLCITFDDGYRDNLKHALPILEKFNCPATIYINTRFPEGETWMWWYEIWDYLLKTERIEFIFEGEMIKWDCSNALKKKRCYSYLSSLIMNLTLEQQKKLLNTITGSDERLSYTEICLDWNEIRELDANPLITIGAHTHSHPVLVLEKEFTALDEIRKSKIILEEKLGHPVLHFAYPFGSKKEAGSREYLMANKCGFHTATTTLCYPASHHQLHSLPRYGVEQNCTVNEIHTRILGLSNLLGKQLA